jgi:hypothetical protein
VLVISFSLFHPGLACSKAQINAPPERPGPITTSVMVAPLPANLLPQLPGESRSERTRPSGIKRSNLTDLEEEAARGAPGAGHSLAAETIARTGSIAISSPVVVRLVWRAHAGRVSDSSPVCNARGLRKRLDLCRRLQSPVRRHDDTLNRCAAPSGRTTTGQSQR